MGRAPLVEHGEPLPQLDQLVHRLERAARAFQPRVVAARLLLHVSARLFPRPRLMAVVREDVGF